MVNTSKGSLNREQKGNRSYSDGLIYLWRSVLAQVIADAKNTTQTRDAQYNKDIALTWGSRLHRDLIDVCYLANVCPEKFVETFNKLERIEEPWRLVRANGLQFKRKDRFHG